MQDREGEMIHLTLTRREADVVLDALDFIEDASTMDAEKVLKRRIIDHYTTPILGNA